jgi:hypothetical protein
MKPNGRKKMFSHVVVGVLALSIGASVTVAAGVAGGVITACENVATGILRIETQNAPCIVSGSSILARAPLLREERITWNQFGQQGLTGSAGPAGGPGPAGPIGSTGPTGAQGPAGPQGPSGAQGLTGVAGTPGPIGATGVPGPKGETGAAGATGPAGNLAGLDALAGKPCNTGATIPGTLEITYDSMSGSVSLVCHMQLFTLAVTRSGTGTGDVDEASNITCGSVCSHSYPAGATVTLTTQNGTSSGFTGWGGACAGTASTCVLVMNSNKSVDASFWLGVTLKIAIRDGSPDSPCGGIGNCYRHYGGGDVTDNANGISCSLLPDTWATTPITICDYLLLSGTNLVLTETPASGYSFDSRTQGCVGVATTCSLTLTMPTQVELWFKN